ncbi:response regulator [Arthrobacter sp. ATA002]|uniref:response regulator n=1 Tax=Arthrobacter sp. ATA002 TaxID=2991715 RepID=UPI002E36F781|nr:response regulator transcription factor [Arthrobacter sp. ATA002]
MSVDLLKVLIADDEPLIRAGLRLILDGAPDISIIGEAGDGETAVVLAAELMPDVVLMDIRMPRLSGIAATERITAPPQPPRVIVLTSFDTDDFILSALRAGASGFLLKDTAPADMVSAVRAAAADNLRFSPESSNALSRPRLPRRRSRRILRRSRIPWPPSASANEPSPTLSPAG